MANRANNTTNKNRQEIHKTTIHTKIYLYFLLVHTCTLSFLVVFPPYLRTQYIQVTYSGDAYVKCAEQWIGNTWKTAREHKIIYVCPKNVHTLTLFCSRYLLRQGLFIILLIFFLFWKCIIIYDRKRGNNGDVLQFIFVKWTFIWMRFCK